MLNFLATIARIAARPIGKVGLIASEVSANVAARVGIRQERQQRDRAAENRLRRVMER